MNFCYEIVSLCDGSLTARLLMFKNFFLKDVLVSLEELFRKFEIEGKDLCKKMDIFKEWNR